MFFTSTIFPLKISATKVTFNPKHAIVELNSTFTVKFYSVKAVQQWYILRINISYFCSVVAIKWATSRLLDM